MGFGRGRVPRGATARPLPGSHADAADRLPGAPGGGEAGAGRVRHAAGPSPAGAGPPAALVRRVDAPRRVTLRRPAPIASPQTAGRASRYRLPSPPGARGVVARPVVTPT